MPSRQQLLQEAFTPAPIPEPTPTWSQLTPTGGPPTNRAYHSSVYDTTNNRMTIFAGGTGQFCSGAPPLKNDVWTLTNTDGSGGTPSWNQLFPTGTPPAPRGGQASVYDPATNRMIVYGGDLSIGNCFSAVNDVWVLTNANGLGGTPAWTQLAPSGGPPNLRQEPKAVYHSATNRLIVYSGNANGCSPFNAGEVWVLSNANGLGGAPAWTQLAPTGAAPAPRTSTSLEYDAANNRMLVFGGSTASGLKNDAWVLSNADGLVGTPNWTQLLPSGSVPGVRYDHTAVYNPAVNQMAVFGGADPVGNRFNDVWVLSNANGLGGAPAWTQVTTTGGPPAQRSGHTAVYNPTSNRMTIYAGWDTSCFTRGDLWVLADVTSAAPSPSPSPAACDQTPTEFPIPAGSNPIGIATGPDGNLWFTEDNANKIGRITTAGVITEFAIPTTGSNPFWIAAGPDGALWFTEQGANKIGRITTAGVVTNEFAIPTAGSTPAGIAAGPDGALWFTEQVGNKIGRITTAGVITEFTVPTVFSVPYDIAAGPDGALWFTEVNANKIGRITTAGVVTNEFPVPTNGQAENIAQGPDGALWFTEFSGNNIGRITTAGVVTNEFAIPTAGSFPIGIAAGPDGALWFIERTGNKIGRITTAGAITEFAIPTAGSAPWDIAAGPDGALWFTEQVGNKIGRICPLPTPTPQADLSITKTASPSGSVATGSQITYTITVNNAGPGTATSVNVNDPLPAGTAFVSVMPSQGSCTAPPPNGVGTVNCLLGSVNSGSSATITLVVSVTAVPGSTISNTATVSSASTDPNPANDSATASTSVAAGVCSVINTNDSGPGSLRRAILCANTNPGPDTVSFNIPITDPGFNGSVFTIRPQSPLPILTDNATTIDGATQTAFTGNTNAAGPEIVLNGGLMGFSAPFGGGLNIPSSANHINSLVINGFNNTGISITGAGATGNLVTGCFLGTNASGSVAVPNTFDGMVITQGASNNVVGGTSPPARNLISGNARNGMTIQKLGTNNNIVQGNFIGTDVTGTTPLSNAGGGIQIGEAANGNLVGGTSPGARNLISGNGGNGLSVINSDSTANQVQGNFIGTNAAGTAAIANGASGVLLRASLNNTVGGTASGAGNLISGNGFAGITINNSATGNQVQGNFIGTNAAGAAALPNGGVGVSINSTGNTVGGTTAAARNVISGNNAQGVRLITGGATLNVVQGNYIGTDASGTTALGNGGNGIVMNLGASGNQIGGTTPGAGNIVSGNGGSGIYCLGVGTSNNTIQGNFCGTNATGSAALPNQVDGIRFDSGTSDNLVGGSARGAGNIVSGNLAHGIHIDDFPVDGGPHLGTARNTVQGNFIGTDISGTLPIGNHLPGVIIFGGASDNLIGGTDPGAGNVIAFSTGRTIDDGQGGFIFVAGTGISVANDNLTVGDSAGGNSVRNRISQNSIFSNNGLGIDLSNLANGVDPTQGPTINDSCDPDAEPNNLQNFPVLTSVSSSGGSTTILGTLNSTPSTTFTIEFFSNDVCDPSGFGEGQTFIGSTTVATDANCNASFTFTTTAPLSEQFITATATDPVGNTSEFSACGFVNADISINKTASPNPVVTGSDLTYTVSVNYSGPAPAANVTVTDNLPSQTTFKSITAPAGWSCTTPAIGSNGTVSCTKTTMAPSESPATFTIVTTVDCSVADGTSISDTATVSSSTTDADPTNNSSTATVTASNPPPAINCPPDKDVPNDPGQCSATVNPGTATATDNCSGVTVSGVRSDGRGLNDSYPVGTTTITWTATDSEGKRSSCKQMITVRDIEKPTITDVADKTIECTSSTDPSATGTATATDNCGTATVTYADAAMTDACGNTGVFVRTWTATDSAGNSSTSTQTITIVDTTAPTLSAAPADTTVECDSVPSAATLTATDNCDSSPVVSYSETRADGNCPNNYTLTRTWTAKDSCGNSSSKKQVIKVQDTTKPKFATPPTNHSAFADANCQAPMPDFTAGVVANDNCSTVTLSQSPAVGTSMHLGHNPVRVTATDACGNATSVDVVFDVTDNTPPSITCPANITMVDNVPGSCGASINPGKPATSDNCGIKSVVGVRSDGKALTDLYPVATTTITWTATDNSGNTTSCTQTVTVTNPPPAVIITGPITPQAVNTPVNSTATFTDNPGDTHTAVWTFDGSPQPGTVNEIAHTITATHTFTTLGVHTVSVTVTDDCGQTGTANSSVLIYALATAPGNGSFVIGDGNAAVGTQVTFWGAQWWKLNTLSGGTAPSSFKGFANRTSTTPPTCGGTWATDPGNSSDPPGSIPAYIGVFVSSSITQSGSTISGNIRQMVVVKTNPGYDSNPGHAGTGTVVAVICQ